MKIQSKELTVAQITRAAVALGKEKQYLDNQRNIRPATLAEIEDYCFGPLRELTLKYERQVALASVPINVAPFDEPPAP